MRELVQCGNLSKQTSPGNLSKQTSPVSPAWGV